METSQVNVRQRKRKQQASKKGYGHRIKHCANVAGKHKNEENECRRKGIATELSAVL